MAPDMYPVNGAGIHRAVMLFLLLIKAMHGIRTGNAAV